MNSEKAKGLELDGAGYLRHSLQSRVMVPRDKVDDKHDSAMDILEKKALPTKTDNEE